MISHLLAALAIQAVQKPTITNSYTPPADLPAAVARAVDTCVGIQIFLEANPEQQIATPRRAQTTPDGAAVLYRIDRGLCLIMSEEWKPDGDLMAQAVETGLAQLPDPPVRTRWRETFVTERGPSTWTSFERRDAAGQLLGVIDLFEPADGATGEVSVTYQASRR